MAITSALAMTIDGAKSYGAAAESVNAKVWGALGDGIADDTAALQAACDYCFGPAAAPHGLAAYRNKTLLIPPGVYNISAPLQLTNIRGGRIVGCGRYTTRIINTASSPVFITNGFERSHVGDMEMESPGCPGPIFDLNWDGTSGGASLQSNTFQELDFHSSAAIGVQIGADGYMGSENLFLSCFFGGMGTAGIVTKNYNALQNTMIGGNIAGCGIGVWIYSGSFTLIASVGFQQQIAMDIQVDNAADDVLSVQACRTESRNFVTLGNGAIGVLTGCTQVTPSSAKGIFLDTRNCSATIRGCVSDWGKVLPNGGLVSIEDSAFGRSDWLETPTNPGLGFVEARNVLYGQTYAGRGSGSPIIINRQRITPTQTLTYILN